MILDTQCNHTFDASCDESSKSFFYLNYEQYIHGWHLNNSNTKEIETKNVNFYNYYTDPNDLQANEEAHLFPKRFVVNVEKQSKCAVDLSTMITVTLFEMRGKRSEQHISLKLFAKSSMTTKPSTALSPQSLPQPCHAKYTSVLPVIGYHLCGKDNNKPTLKELMEYSDDISEHWKQIALNLYIPDRKVDTINVDNACVRDKCFNMFDIWLKRTTDPCWCHFIWALNNVELYKVAQKANKHLEKPSDECSSVTESTNAHVSEIKSPSLHELVRYLRHIPEKDLRYFIFHLFLSTEKAKNVIILVRISSGSHEHKVKKVCQEYLKEQDPSWTKVNKALQEAGCNNLACIIEVTFITPTQDLLASR